MSEHQDEFTAKIAKRAAAPVTAAFMGISGSGKTLSALRFARGLVGPNGKIIMLDTEGNRGLIYADDPEAKSFHHVDFKPPYSSERFRAAIKSSVAQGAQAIIIDSASHEHEAEGGMLEFADSEEHRLGSAGSKRIAQQKWIKPKIAHNRFIRTAVSAPCHVIFCLRLKRIVDISTTPAKEVFEPVMEKGLLFDMMIALRLEDKGHAYFLKVPEPFLRHIEEGAQITVDHGRLLLEEASRGEAVDEKIEGQRVALEELARDYGTPNLADAWKALGKDMQHAVGGRPELERLKALAAATDIRLAAEEQAKDGERATANLLENGDKLL